MAGCGKRSLQIPAPSSCDNRIAAGEIENHPRARRLTPSYGRQADAARFLAADAPGFSMTSNLDEPVVVCESLRRRIICRFGTSDRPLKPVYDSRGQGMIRYSAVSDVKIMRSPIDRLNADLCAFLEI